MARYKDELVIETFKPQLEAGETLKHFAYGVKQPALALIPLLGVIAAAVLTKEYIVGLTEKRLLIMRVSGKINVKEFREYDLGELPPATTSTGKLFTHITLEDENNRFVAKFHRLGMKQNREHAMAIGAAITGQG